MEKKNKIIIAALVILIISLAVGIVSVLMNNNALNDTAIPEGMEKYDFNSEFTMAVPKNAKFLKEWNNTNEFGYGEGYSYFDRSNKFAVAYFDSPMLTHDLINSAMDIANKSGNVTLEVEGDLIISHSLINKAKIGNSLEKTNFTDVIFIQKGHKMVMIQGIDLEFIKSMAKTIEFYE